MKTLLIGNTNSIWIKKYIDEILLPFGHEVFLQDDIRRKCVYKDEYLSKGIKFVGDFKLNPILMKIPVVMTAHYKNSVVSAIKDGNNYDNIVVIYCDSINLSIALSAKSKNTNVYTLFIGSDIFRANKIELTKIKKIIKELDANVVCSSLNLVEKCSSLFNKKCSLIDFGNSSIPYIDKAFDMGIEECKKHFSNNSDLIYVTAGYNANEAHQHKKIIDALSNQKNKDKLFVIFPMTYNGKKEYIDEVESYANSKGLKNIFLRTYMSEEDIGILRAATDIFIHAQKTDALSSSLLESIYAGSIVLNGKWLYYKELDEMGIKIDYFSDFDDLNKQLNEILENYPKRDYQYKMKISTYYSWDTCRAKWKKMFKGDKNV